MRSYLDPKAWSLNSKQLFPNLRHCRLRMRLFAYTPSLCGLHPLPALPLDKSTNGGREPNLSLRVSPIRERVFGFTPQTILVLLLGQGGAGTETLAAEPVRMLAETVVTASTVPLDADRVGSAMTVISGEALEQRQIRVVSDALRAVPGLSVNRAGPLGSTTQVRIRGAEANHTLVLIDGVEANDPVSGSLFDFAHLSAYDVERIEILRGPQSALWGSDAIGGVVNIITRRGKAGYQVSGIAEGGAFGTAQTQARVAGAGPRFDWAVSASTLSTDGINISRFGDEDDAFDNTTVQLTSGLQPDEHFEVAASARFTESDRQFDDQDFGAGSPTQGFIVDSDDHTIARQFYGGLQGKARLFDGHWEQAASLGVTRTQNDNFSLGVSSGRSDGEKHKITYRSTFFWDTAPLAPAGHSLTFLVEREKELFSNRGASSPSAEDQDQSTVDYGMVAEYRLDLFDRVSMSGAVRRDLNDRFAHATTYRLTGAYRHAPTGTRVHASLGTGITSPHLLRALRLFSEVLRRQPGPHPRGLQRLGRGARAVAARRPGDD